MPKPRVLVLTGYGINCDEETKFAFEKSGAKSELVHINDLIDSPKRLSNYQILAFPGGFSYGDDTGAGNALANRIRNHLWDNVKIFSESDKLVIGICNGFQIMANLGLLPAVNGDYGKRQIALIHNDSVRYLDRWVDLEFKNNSIWTRGLEKISLPIAHGEGKFYADSETMKSINEKGLIAAKYIKGEICETEYLPSNPNGSLEDIAAISDESGRLIGMMPHPERAIDFTQFPHWTLLREQLKREGKKIPIKNSGMLIFEKGVKYFS